MGGSQLWGSWNWIVAGLLLRTILSDNFSHGIFADVVLRTSVSLVLTVLSASCRLDALRKHLHGSRSCALHSPRAL